MKATCDWIRGFVCSALPVLMSAGGCTDLARDPQWEMMRQEVEQPAEARTIGMVADRNGFVTVFDADSLELLGTVELPGFHDTVGDCSITSDQSMGFVTDFQSFVHAIDLTGPAPSLAEAPNPIPIANPGEDTSLSPDERHLVVCDGGTRVPVSVIDVATRTQVSSFDLGHDCNSVEVCSDGSVLVTSVFENTVRRLTIDAAGNLHDTGESLSVSDPNNVICAPDGASGIVVEREADTIQSFTIPGLGAVDSQDMSGDFGISARFSPDGTRVYTRDNGGFVEAFDYDVDTASIGDAPVYSIAISDTPTFYGMDQLDVHPNGDILYVSQPGAVKAFLAADGSFLGSVTGPNLFNATGVCLTRAVLNEAPVALCSDVVVEADATCQAAASIDAGSFDPDGDPIVLSQTPPGPYPLGDTLVSLAVTDDGGASATCEAFISVIDATAPAVECHAPATIIPPDAPISFTATAADNCGPASTEIIEFDCFAFNRAGKRVDKRDSCEVELANDTITISDSGGVGDHITWTAVAQDGSGNITEQRCEVVVVNPGRGAHGK
jgi:hypothetical protein